MEKVQFNARIHPEQKKAVRIEVAEFGASNDIVCSVALDQLFKLSRSKRQAFYQLARKKNGNREAKELLEENK